MQNNKWHFIRAGVPLMLAAFLSGCSGPDEPAREQARPPAPVNVAGVERGPIRLLRTFSGTLESGAEFVVSPKVGGRLEAIAAQIGQPVTRGTVVARLDDDEHEQALIQTEADLLVAKANLAESKSVLEIAQREIDRTTTLFGRGVASDAELDAAKSELLATEARVQVFEAQVTRAEAAVQAAKIRIAYAQVTAAWPEGDEKRLIAERYVDAGQTIAANDPLLRIVDLDPLVGVFYVTEKDYARLTRGQQVQLATDAFPDETFEGSIAHISPVFQESSRQARVELTIPNADYRLKPGMFIRATVELDRAPDAIIVPESALVTRQDNQGVFLVGPDGASAKWQPVNLGIREGDRVQILRPVLEGNVITLGQHLIDDGSAIAIANPAADVNPEVTGG